MDGGGKMYVRLKADTIKRMPSGEFWWRARDFLVLQCVTGGQCPDGTKPIDLYQIAVEWSRNLAGIPPDFNAEFPFPDWKGEPPIPGGELSGYY